MQKTTTVILIALLCFSIAGGIHPAAAQTVASPTLRVAWNVANQTTQVQDSEQQSKWVFGPQPTVTIEYANGTDIAENSYRIEVGNHLFVNITIPKAFLGVGNELDSVQFWGTSKLARSPSFGLEYNATADRWNSAVYVYVPGVEAPRSSNFIHLNSLASFFAEEADYYKVIFAITYEVPIFPQMLSTGMQVIDTNGNPIMSSWFAENIQGQYGSPPIGFSIGVNPLEFSLPEYYYADIINEAGNPLHYVDVGDEFIVRMVSSAQIGKALIPFTQLTQNSSYEISVNWTFPGETEYFQL